MGAPPASVGKFGGDTDNWMWPRHTCDFSMFRVYAGPDNEPADYSPNNVPFTPKQFLGVSLKGIEDGSFAMIMGYPGSTQRFQTAAQLEEMLAVNDIRIAARGLRQDILWKAMRADEAVSLKYASKYSGSSNGWKKWIGEKEAFEALDIIGREKQKEKDLQAWIEDEPGRMDKWGDAISRIEACVAGSAEAEKAATLLQESVGRIELLNFAASVDNPAPRRMGPPQGPAPAPEAAPDKQAQIDQAVEMIRDYYKDYDATVDHDAAIAMIDFYKQNVKPGDAVKIGGKSILTMDTRKLVDNMFKKSIFTSEEKLLAKPVTEKVLNADPAVKMARGLMEAIAPMRQGMMSRAALNDASKAYAAALLEWKKGEPSYPDANMTCRLTYGNVMSYEPKDGVEYKYYTTLKGVMEKEDPDNYEFRVPAKLKEIFQKGDFGQYANKDGELVACFITNLDITGGNSGSPVMDADGNLIGLAFDGNWEAMSSDVMFEPNLQRCICVDIRYVLLLMDKFGGAGYLLDEMNLVKE